VGEIRWQIALKDKMMTEPNSNIAEELNDATTQASNDGSETAPNTAPANDDAATQIAALKDQLLRAVAEAENTRRRAQKEREDTAKYAVDKFAKEMLAVADNFERALSALPKDVSDPAIKNLVVGIEATGRQLAATFDRFGIKKMDPLGKTFDPHFHSVMMEAEDASKPAGTITQIMQAGYTIHDRLLREALVAVSRGGPTKVDVSA
jgi:molecular chaperone GrpE